HPRSNIGCAARRNHADAEITGAGQGATTMKSLDEQVLSYAAYHRDPRNKLTHFFGVPLVTFALFVLLGWVRIVEEPLPVTGATLFWLTVFVYYLALDWRVALLQAPVSLLLLGLADVVSRWPWPESLAVFAGAFVG